MIELLRQLFEVGGEFMPHGYCLQWNPWIFWSYLLSDALTFFCYVSNFFALYKLYKRRVDLQFGWILPAFGLFIASCGVVHGLLVVSLFWGIYPAVAVAKVLMAAISLPVAVIIWPTISRVIKLPELSAYYYALDKVNELERDKVIWKKKNADLLAEIKTLKSKNQG